MNQTDPLEDPFRLRLLSFRYLYIIFNAPIIKISGSIRKSTTEQKCKYLLFNKALRSYLYILCLSGCLFVCLKVFYFCNLLKMREKYYKIRKFFLIQFKEKMLTEKAAIKSWNRRWARAKRPKSLISKSNLMNWAIAMSPDWTKHCESMDTYTRLVHLTWVLCGNE